MPSFLTMETLTGSLAFVGFLQLCVFAWQGYQLKRTVEVAVRSEIPKVVLSDMKFGRKGSDDPFDNTKLPLVSVRFTNYGRQAAQIVEASLEMCLYSELPNKPIYPNKTSAPVGRIIEAGNAYTFPDRTWHDSAALEKLGRCISEPPQDRFCVYGFLAYLDHFGKRHETGFFAWLNTTGQSFGWDEIPKLRSATFVVATPKGYTYQR